MLILSHPTGNANVRQAARAINEAGVLGEFWTSISWDGDHALNRVLPFSLKAELGRRSFPQVSSEQIHSRPWPEVMRLFAQRFGFAGLTRRNGGRYSIDAVYRKMDKRVADRLRVASGIDAVYAYEDGALETFRTARHLGIKTIYELPIGYWKVYRELMKEEAELEPEWAATLPGNADSAEKLRCKDEELALADHVIAPSRFVRDTLSKAGSYAASVDVVPYGASAAIAASREARKAGGKLKVVFVGALTQRKGLSYLFRAVEQLGSNVELTLIGRRVGPSSALDRALSAHHWIPSLPHEGVLREVSRHHVMVFPSLFEGSALVVLEAMSVGVPVITTRNGGAPDFISDGIDGFLVPIRSAEAIVEKLDDLHRRPEKLEAMSHKTLAKVGQYSWERYRNQLAELVRRLIRNKPLARPDLVPDSGSTCECNVC